MVESQGRLELPRKYLLRRGVCECVCNASTEHHESQWVPVRQFVSTFPHQRSDCRYASKSCNSRRDNCVSNPCGMIDTRPGTNDSMSSRPTRISTRSVVIR